MNILQKHRSAWLSGGLLLATTATAAIAGSGVGGVFNLGQVNTVNTTTRLNGTTATRQLWVSNASTAIGSTAVAGIASGGIGVWGQSDRRIGVRALTTRTSGMNYGVYSTTASADGLAGYFENTNGDSPFNGTALRAISEGSAADLLDAGASDAAGEFVGRTGLIGVSTPQAASGYGVVGVAVASGGNGVVGRGGERGVFGIGATGVHGTGGIGVYGDGDTYGVYSDGDAFVDGDLNVEGAITKGSGTFKIDHPLDPANKYLSHSFVESPDMMNIYNGNVTTDANGVAVVELPDYFEALNRDARYQLTVIGLPVLAYIAEKISANRFTIRTEEPNVEVSWQVTGIRQDAYAAAHPIIVEEEKAMVDRGRYLHPEEHGQPADLAIGKATRSIAGFGSGHAATAMTQSLPTQSLGLRGARRTSQ